jgi:hypothetical protein
MFCPIQIMWKQECWGEKLEAPCIIYSFNLNRIMADLIFYITVYFILLYRNTVQIHPVVMVALLLIIKQLTFFRLNRVSWLRDPGLNEKIRNWRSSVKTQVQYKHSYLLEITKTWRTVKCYYSALTHFNMPWKSTKIQEIEWQTPYLKFWFLQRIGLN